jgi:hypothetical protein
MHILRSFSIEVRSFQGEQVTLYNMETDFLERFNDIRLGRRIFLQKYVRSD